MVAIKSSHFSLMFASAILATKTAANQQIRGNTLKQFEVFQLNSSNSLQQQVCEDSLSFCENIPNFLCNISLLQNLCPNKCATALLSLSDSELWDMATNGNLIGEYCRVSGPNTGTACNYYVKGEITTSYDGVPRNTDDEGTGCVQETEGVCYYDNAEYDLTTSEREDMCSGELEANAAAQLRYGISNGYCGCF